MSRMATSSEMDLFLDAGFLLTKIGVTTVDQLVLPVKCRKFVLHTAHTILSAGHL